MDMFKGDDKMNNKNTEIVRSLNGIRFELQSIRELMERRMEKITKRNTAKG